MRHSHLQTILTRLCVARNVAGVQQLMCDVSSFVVSPWCIRVGDPLHWMPFSQCDVSHVCARVRALTGAYVL